MSGHRRQAIMLGHQSLPLSMQAGDVCKLCGASFAMTPSLASDPELTLCRCAVPLLQEPSRQKSPLGKFTLRRKARWTQR